MSKYPYEKVYHYANLISDDGQVSALCFARPRPIDLRRASWTNRREAVTCPKCLRSLGLHGVPAIKPKMCRCGHSRRLHSERMCLIDRCRCLSFRPDRPGKAVDCG